MLLIVKLCIVTLAHREKGPFLVFFYLSFYTSQLGISFFRQRR